MPSKKQYDLVSEDGYDSRIPLHNEEAFQHGIQFQAKYIGTMDVPRPSSRVEIVAAMRRIRYEFKAKAIKKKKVTLAVSVEGVQCILRKKTKKKHQWVNWEDSKMILMQHPIYRIFYVSHDSQDLKIFSYIARDGASNVFKCNVFKAYKKSQAMRIVRTVGQAFEVCHKMSVKTAPHKQNSTEIESERSSQDGEVRSNSSRKKGSPKKSPVKGGPPGYAKDSPEHHPDVALRKAQELLEAVASKPQQSEPPGTLASPLASPLGSPLTDTPLTPTPISTLPIAGQHQMQLLREQLEQQTQQTQVAVSQVTLLKDQLEAETAARIEAQARNHQLLVHNRELLDHINALVTQLKDQEAKISGTPPPDWIKSPMVQNSPLPAATTPASVSVMSPDFPDLNSSHVSQNPNFATYVNSNIKSDNFESPDSGHKEMSSDSLSNNISPLNEYNSSWYTPNYSGTNGHDPILQKEGNKPSFGSMPRSQSERSYTPSQRDSGYDTQKHTRKLSSTSDKGFENSLNASRNNQRLSLNGIPKLDPPPRVARNSSQSPRNVDIASPESIIESCTTASPRSSTTSSGTSSGIFDRRRASPNPSFTEGNELLEAFAQSEAAEVKKKSMKPASPTKGLTNDISNKSMETSETSKYLEQSPNPVNQTIDNMTAFESTPKNESYTIKPSYSSMEKSKGPAVKNNLESVRKSPNNTANMSLKFIDGHNMNFDTNEVNDNLKNEKCESNKPPLLDILTFEEFDALDGTA